jgi:hypothetical protein
MKDMQQRGIGRLAMTRRTILVLITLFSSLVFANVASPVGAEATCDLNAQKQCARALDAAALADVPGEASLVQAAGPLTIYRVSDAYLFVPRPGGMWAVIYVQPDGWMVTEDYVSGPPPSNGIAITP